MLSHVANSRAGRERAGDRRSGMREDEGGRGGRYGFKKDYLVR